MCVSEKQVTFYAQSENKRKSNKAELMQSLVFATSLIIWGTPALTFPGCNTQKS